MKIALSAAAVLAVAGAASAAPFQLQGYITGGSTGSPIGITVDSGVFHRSAPLGSTSFLGGRLVAPANQTTWDYYKAGLTSNPTTFLGALGGEAPLDWATVGPTPGGDLSPGFATFANNQNVINNGGWFRAGLGPVSSAPADIVGAGEYMWLGQLVVPSGASIAGDIELLVIGQPTAQTWLINSGEFTGGLTVFTTVVGQDSAGRDIHYMYATDVPAPGAFALLGVAGLAASRRRR